MTSGRIGSAVGGGASRVIPGTASRLLESAMQVSINVILGAYIPTHIL